MGTATRRASLHRRGKCTDVRALIIERSGRCIYAGKQFTIYRDVGARVYV